MLSNYLCISHTHWPSCYANCHLDKMKRMLYYNKFQLRRICISMHCSNLDTELSKLCITVLSYFHNNLRDSLIHRNGLYRGTCQSHMIGSQLQQSCNSSSLDRIFNICKEVLYCFDNMIVGTIANILLNQTLLNSQSHMTDKQWENCCMKHKDKCIESMLLISALSQDQNSSNNIGHID